MVDNAQMVKLIQNISRENGMRVPCRSTCYKLIKHLPAAKPKAMRGINPAQENAMAAFDILRKLTNDLGQVTGGMSNAERTALLKCIDNGHQYMRSHLAFDIKEDSNCDSHCFKHACSDPNHPEFSSTCTTEHTEDCYQCHNIFFILEALEMAIDRARESNSKRDCDEMMYDLKKARNAIKDFHSHLMKASLCSSNPGTPL